MIGSDSREFNIRIGGRAAAPAPKTTRYESRGTDKHIQILYISIMCVYIYIYIYTYTYIYIYIYTYKKRERERERERER